MTDDKDIKNELLQSFQGDELAERKKKLEKEIAEIDKVIKGGKLGKEKHQDWYEKYPAFDSLLAHPDFHLWRNYTMLMGFAGLGVGGIIGYRDGLDIIRDQLKKASYNPLSGPSEFGMNSRRIIGQNVVRGALIYSYRLSLYTSIFLGTDLAIKNNVTGDQPLISRTIAGSVVGGRAGPSSIGLGCVVGTATGMLSGILVYLTNPTTKNNNTNNNTTTTTPSTTNQPTSQS
ncbi:hypothetical protein DFA_00276 [Cavenderia fasciculata]|uniref:Uncharacterized protein n=1 Tax=Cavenderia fasciculata TaxID=261658 RepID=F4PY38_CACFS|nr:uncharacterized protein DFA_00276 [Cavenderia fasciculata]EGG19698.1 hypothetical protein DFA_00276 [Cavenderia fasciculata]|eukprot:XP_004357992.1 hypothetical protein DFA_00276 [Cavenderia fasciculata]